jgi:hypothetical protein
VAPATGTERVLADLLASTLGVERVSVESHFFAALGANSLLMARFNAAIRERADMPAVSMKDVYLNPTVRRLAAALAEAGPAPERSAREGSARDREPEPASASYQAVAPSGTPRYVLCGALQLLVFLGYICAGSLALDASSSWLAAGGGVLGVYGRAVVCGGGVLLGLGALPIAAKWVLSDAGSRSESGCGASPTCGSGSSRR